MTSYDMTNTLNDLETIKIELDEPQNPTQDTQIMILGLLGAEIRRWPILRSENLEDPSNEPDRLEKIEPLNFLLI